MPEYRVHHDHHHHIFTSTVTVEELAGSPLSDVEKAAQLAVTGRKNWKTLRDKGEAVWPLKLCVDNNTGVLSLPSSPHYPFTVKAHFLKVGRHRNWRCRDTTHSRGQPWKNIVHLQSEKATQFVFH